MGLSKGGMSLGSSFCSSREYNDKKVKSEKDDIIQYLRVYHRPDGTTIIKYVKDSQNNGITIDTPKEKTTLQLWNSLTKEQKEWLLNGSIKAA